MNDLDTAVEYITPGNISLEKGMLMNDFSLISNEFEIRNPDELYEFIKDKEGFIELINKSLDLFKAYYPNSTYTLEYIDYLEGYEFNIIFCFISDDDSFDIDLYDKLSDDFTDLIFQFEDIKKYYSFCID